MTDYRKPGMLWGPNMRRLIQEMRDCGVYDGTDSPAGFVRKVNEFVGVELDGRLQPEDWSGRALGAIYDRAS